jgi:surface antigen
MNSIMKKTFLVTSLIFLFGFSPVINAECVQQQEETGGGELFGTLIGAAVGGLVGSQIGGGTGNKVAIGAGVLAGGFLGNQVGKSLDCQDQQYHYDTTQNALETQKVGQSSSWTNPDTGHSGEITPTRTYTSQGQPCRDFTQTILIDGEEEKINGTACRQDDGSWKPVS